MGQKEGGFGIDSHNEIIALLGHVKKVGAHTGRNTRNVDEKHNIPLLLRRPKQQRTRIGIGQVSPHIRKREAFKFLRRIRLGNIHPNDRKACAQKCFDAFLSDATEGTRNDSYFHFTFSL